MGKMTFACPHCYKGIQDKLILAAAASISSARRQTHGAGRGTGRAKGLRKCPKCKKFHMPEEMRKCKGESK